MCYPCARCMGDVEPELFDEVEVCEDLSRKSTWEIGWENFMEEVFYEGRRDEVRAYVLERLKDAPD